MSAVVLYSTNTYLAYVIAERYYGGNHYVWCSEVFDARAQYKYGPYANIPPTSSPYEIYRSLLEEVRRGDLHSAKIASSRRNIIHGATFKLNAGVINQTQYDEIVNIVERAGTDLFKPLLFVIPYDKVVNELREVAVDQRAHPLSREYIIESLARSNFDVIEVNHV